MLLTANMVKMPERNRFRLIARFFAEGGISPAEALRRNTKVNRLKTIRSEDRDLWTYPVFAWVGSVLFPLCETFLSRLPTENREEPIVG